MRHLNRSPRANLRLGLLALAFVAILLVALVSPLGGAPAAFRTSVPPTAAVTFHAFDNGSNNNSGGNGSFSLPSGLVTLALVGGLVFVILLVLIAAGVLALAVLTSRRLRQINETLAQLSAPPKGPTPPP